MNIRNITMTLAVAIVAGFGGCNAPQRSIAGQVFITSGTSTLRLPLTEIYVLEMPRAAELLQIIRQRRAAKLAELARELAANDAQMRAAIDGQPEALTNSQNASKEFVRLSDLRQKLVSLVADSPSIVEREAARAELQRIGEKVGAAWKAFSIATAKPGEFQKLYDQQKKVLAAFDLTRSSLLEEQVKAQTLSHYAGINGIPAAARATSDADGKFNIPAPKRDVVLFARSPTKGVEQENYIWLVAVNGNQNSVMLTDKNLLESFASENFAGAHCTSH
jgi:hypothetical protein